MNPCGTNQPASRETLVGGDRGVGPWRRWMRASLTAE